MEFDFSKLRGRIIEKFGTNRAFAQYMGMSNGALSYRLNNKIAWTCGEVYLAIQPEGLNIAPQDIPVYFFKPKVL